MTSGLFPTGLKMDVSYPAFDVSLSFPSVQNAGIRDRSGRSARRSLTIVACLQAAP